MDGGGVENQNHDSGEVPVAQNGIDFGTVADPSLSTEREVSDEDLGFSSEDIAKREKTEYFTNVKGAEKIKRQEERKREAEEKERLKKLKKLEAEDIIAQKQFEAKEQDDRVEKRIILDQKLEKQKAEFAAFNNRVLNFFFACKKDSVRNKKQKNYNSICQCNNTSIDSFFCVSLFH